MDFFHFFAQPETEHRHDSQPYPILELTFLTMNAVISGAKTWQDIRQFGEQHLSWLRRYLAFEQGIPPETTLAALICKLQPSQFNDIFINFINELRQAQQLEWIPLDGKNLRNCFGHEAKSALHSILIQPKTRGVRVVYRDERGLLSKDNGEKCITALRYYALHLARLHPARCSLRMKLKRAADSDRFREALLFGGEGVKADLALALSA